ncbi:uncharacterized protein LOC17884996 isoform X2 [Capsella rubella]|uniref:uncharacterized protein LOC17884996 isoform X2 n=1 Tax=Capsella rubella TaxID=81985 RepID=UPI000CD535BE|nr:uncharacterized protein LOC17884996 isoform X2 [Capsella rubella]
MPKHTPKHLFFLLLFRFFTSSFTLLYTQALPTFHTSFSLLSFHLHPKLMDFDSSEKRESVEEEETVMMEYDEETNQFDVEFCPVEHPVEPEEEDRPVKCPVSIPSSLIHSREKTKPGWVKHRASSYETPVCPPTRHHVRNVRKRHNSFDVEAGNNNFFTRSHHHHDDETTTSRRSNVTIYRVLQQVREFEP